MLCLQIKPAFITFWLIYAGTYLLLLLWGGSRYEVFPSGNAMLIGGVAILFFFMIYAGFTTVKKSYALALEMNATRNEFCTAAMIYFLLLAGLNTLAQTAAYLLLEVKLVGALANIGEIYYFSFHGMALYSGITALWIHFITALFVVTASFAVSSLYYRFGKLFLYPALVAAIFGLVNTSLDWWIGLFMIDQVASLGLFSVWLSAASGSFLLLGWLALRRAAVRT